MQLCEPITATVIFPFIFRLVNEMGVTKGNEDKTGYYSGIIVCSFFFPLEPFYQHYDQQESTFYLVETLFILQWGRLSDKIGRKPVVLIGLSGLALSMFSFGLSRSFPTLVASRSLAGLLNGNVGVLKSVLGEITDDTNAAQAFAFLPIVRSVGSTIGQVHAPKLSNPCVTDGFAFALALSSEERSLTQGIIGRCLICPSGRSSLTSFHAPCLQLYLSRYSLSGFCG